MTQNNRPRCTRRVWLLADTHIGRVEDGKDGDQWLRLAIQDLQANLPPVDYALFLGDMTARYTSRQFQKYAQLRDASGISPWYEIAGNHDYHGIESGEYFKWTISPLRYVVLDGNACWLFASAERSNAAGLMGEQTAEWLKESILQHQDKNIILCTHQLVYGTVEYSTRDARYLHPRERVEKLLKEVRVDLCLGGHAHFAPRSTEYAKREDQTTFINVASITHAYNTGACLSYILEMQDGSREASMRCRIHDDRRFAPEFSLTVRFPYPFHFGHRPHLVPGP